MKRFRILFALIGLFAFCQVVQAQLPDQQAALRGLYPPSVNIQKLSEDAKAAGLVAEQLRVDVELRLKRFGVPVSNRNADGTPAYPQIYIRVSIIKSKLDVYLVVISIEVMTVLSKVRPCKPGDQPIVFASIWTAAQFGAFGSEVLEKAVRSRLADLTDDFINDYFAANPKP